MVARQPTAGCADVDRGHALALLRCARVGQSDRACVCVCVKTQVECVVINFSKRFVLCLGRGAGMADGAGMAARARATAMARRQADRGPTRRRSARGAAAARFRAVPRGLRSALRRGCRAMLCRGNAGDYAASGGLLPPSTTTGNGMARGTAAPTRPRAREATLPRRHTRRAASRAGQTSAPPPTVTPANIAARASTSDSPVAGRIATRASPLVGKYFHRATGASV